MSGSEHLPEPPEDYKGDIEKDWRPSRGYKWEQFTKGNLAHLKHGAYSPRKVNPLAEGIAGVVLATGPEYLADPSFAPGVWALARTEARIQLLSEYLDEHGLLEDDGEPRAALDAVYKFERLASEQRTRLGLDPTSRARLERDLATGLRTVDLERLADEGRKVREAAAKRLGIDLSDEDDIDDKGAA